MKSKVPRAGRLGSNAGCPLLLRNRIILYLLQLGQLNGYAEQIGR